ncbi:hypothetical protein SNE40_021590 [Patella caerulea]|uniref:Uncharacterized protein n=1 Tax=Patella caerulea TaxID=87958 RepID=A0AAN8G4E3_PATCE
MSVYRRSVPVCAQFDLGALDNDSDDEQDDTNDFSSIPVKFNTQDVSIRGRLRRLLIRNSHSRLASTFFDLIVKLIICITYVVRATLDDSQTYACNGVPCDNANSNDSSEEPTVFSSTSINWYVVFWVDRPLPLWIVQVVLSAITLSKALLLVYISTKGHRGEHIRTTAFILELICSLPILATVCYPPLLQNLFVPIFLNVWLAEIALERVFNDLHLTRQRFQTMSVTLSQQILLLLASVVSLVYTTICGIQHIQRGSAESKLSMFESFYFVIVTFSTVGYGDISPDIWIGQLFMIIMICVALIFIPRQLEVIASTWIERQKAGGEYSKRTAAGNKHVVVCSSNLATEAVMDFLSEFYAHPKLEDHLVILLSSHELDNSMQVILKDPKWTHRVIYMRGSSLKDLDLKRCRIHEADACFFLAPRTVVDKYSADQHTILRSWAVKDFAPHCKQYIQLFKAQNKMHVKFAEHVVCEDEFKFALLANNCLYPGLSTLVSLLVHTSGGQEAELATEQWQQLYGRHSGNEIYHIQLIKSSFFSRYEGKKFTEASSDAHQRFGVALMAILDTQIPEPRLQLNPGPNYIMKGSDYCFYMSVTKEEYSEISPEALQDDIGKNARQSKTLAEEENEINYLLKRNKSNEQIALVLQKYQNESEDDGDEEESVFDTITSMVGQEITKIIHGKEKEKDTNEKDGDDNSNYFDYLQPDKMTKKMKDGNVMEKEADGLSHRNGTGNILQFYNDMGHEMIMTGPPPTTMYLGSRRTNCHIMKTPRLFCCLEWGKHCEHCTYKNANDDRWTRQLIILSVEYASCGIYNFIVPLRSNFISKYCLSPIILLLEEDPDKIFLETIAQFPLVYWMKGKISSVDDLLRGGINKASHLVVVNKEKHQKQGEETLSDSETIVAVQTIFRLFPNANIITELSQASNLRFMQFSAHDEYSQKISLLEQKLKQETPSNLSYMFRLPFAAGQVFSASMLDTLLYQTFVKGYLITFVRLLLGIDAEQNSGHLSSIRVKRATLKLYPTYGELYQGLCTATGEVPIAIYRTEKQGLESNQPTPPPPPKDFGLKRETTFHARNPFISFQNSDQCDLADLIRNRLKSLDIRDDDYCELKKRPNALSYVILNPSPKRKLKLGDIVHVLQPYSMQAFPSNAKQPWRPRSNSVNILLPRHLDKRKGSLPNLTDKEKAQESTTEKEDPRPHTATVNVEVTTSTPAEGIQRKPSRFTVERKPESALDTPTIVVNGTEC